MKTFESFKEFIVQKCKQANACKPEFARLKKSKNYQELLKVLTDNHDWCAKNKIINAEILLNVEDNELLISNIYVQKTNIEIINGHAFLFNSTVTAWGSSTVTARENSTVTAWGSSTVTARENSTVTAWGSSTVTARENSTVTAWGSSTVTARENSTVTAWGSSTVTARENSTVTAWGSSTVTARENSFVSIYKCDASSIHDNSIVRERSTGNVFFKKDAFNVIKI